MSNPLWGGRPHHQRAREVISPSGGIMRGKFPSRKNGRMVHHEGLLELDALYLLEASPLVQSYREQPITIYYPDGARTRRYTPDLEVTLQTGQTVWVEVKPRRSLQNEEVRHKLSCISAHLERSHQPFVVLTDEVLREQPRQSNVRAIVHRAMGTHATPQAAYMALLRCVHQLPADLATATQLLAIHAMEPYTLLMAGWLRCTLDQPLNHQTLITPTLESDDGWFWLAQAHGF